jgi:hypothetical protein
VQSRFCNQCGQALAAGSAGSPATPPPQTTLSEQERVLQSRQVSWLTDSYGNIIVTRDNNQVTVTRDEMPAFFLRLYYRSLAEECRRLPLGLVNEEFTRPGVERAVSLANVYTDLDVVSGLLSKDKEKKGTRWLGMRLEQGEGGERMALVQAIAQPGAPGSGKSTFVNYLAARLASGEVAGLPEALARPWVVRLELRRAALHVPVEAACGEAEMLWNAVQSSMRAFWGEELADQALLHLQ